jgi:hypothetical protein
MDFWQQVLSTLIGTFAGFLLSLALFYLTETWKNSRTRKDLGANIAKEIQFNLDFLTQYKTDFEKMLRQVTAGDKQIFTVFRHNKLQRLFLQEAFQKGLLYKNLSTDEVVAVDAMLSYFLPYRDQSFGQLLDRNHHSRDRGRDAVWPCRSRDLLRFGDGSSVLRISGLGLGGKQNPFQRRRPGVRSSASGAG